MSFSFTNIPDVRYNYDKLGLEFSRFYYKAFDDDFPELLNIYVDKPCITFRDEKFGSFDELYRRLRNDGIWSFTHHSINGNAQPIDHDSILITTNGTMSANKNFAKHRFQETILLCRNRNNNRFYIHNSIFQIMD